MSRGFETISFSMATPTRLMTSCQSRIRRRIRGVPASTSRDFPGLPKLDLHVDSVSTEQPGLSFDKGYTGGPANAGHFNYWNFEYRDGYTNGGDLIGNAVGRDGRTFEGWLTYWLSPTNNVQFFTNTIKSPPISSPEAGLGKIMVSAMRCICGRVST